MAKKATTKPTDDSAKTSKKDKEVNYILTPEEIEAHNLRGQKIHRAYINDAGELYIKQFGGNGEQDIKLGKKSQGTKDGTWQEIE